jgi:hypothetical protein
VLLGYGTHSAHGFQEVLINNTVQRPKLRENPPEHTESHLKGKRTLRAYIYYSVLPDK